MKNPCSTILNKLRSQHRFYVGQLGLSPVARDAIPKAAQQSSEDDAFD